MRSTPGGLRTSAASSRFAGVPTLGCPISAVTRRGPAREAAICQAAIQLLNEISYESLTMDAVAARAKASKATIYRRWSNKDDLVVDALRRTYASDRDVPPDMGNLHDDLVATIVHQTQDPLLFAANTAAMKGLVYAAACHPELATVIRACLEDAHLADWRALLSRAHRRGELGRPVAAELVWEVLQGQFYARTSVHSATVDSGYVEHLVDDVLMPVISHAGGRVPAP